ncbi:serine/threonine protein kinase [Clostridia bacterium]|nr:serine/threonine protein kinase [Clostridia bacterium]
MLTTGTILDGKYKILHSIAKGGMSEIYLALHEQSDKYWAIKEVNKENTEESRLFLRSLLAEVTLLKELNHPALPNIVDILDRENELLIVMDYIPGKTLQKILTQEGARSEEVAVDWVLQLCDVLDYLHNQNPPVIYRDMKPGNIIVQEYKVNQEIYYRLVLVDFGIARRYKQEQGADTVYLGTRGYAAPEQFLDQEETKQSDARTDIYSLGATLYHMLTGHNPAKAPYTLYPIRQWNPSLSSGLEKILNKCINNNPDERYQNIRQLRYALSQYRVVDEDYQNVQKGRLAIFCGIVIMSCFFAVLAIVSREQIKRKTRDDYYEKLVETNLDAVSSITEGVWDIRIVEEYLAVIEKAPEEEAGYRRLWNYFVGVGKTNNGLNVMMGLLATVSNTEFKQELYLDMAKVAFNGNAQDLNFDANYRLAYQLFSQISKNRYPEVEHYRTLSENLSSLSIDGRKLKSDLEQMQEVIGHSTKEVALDLSLAAANVYRTYAADLETEDQDPFAHAIVLLKQAQEILNSPYFAASYYVNERKQVDIVFALADSYYRQATIKKSKNQDALEEYKLAIDYYQELSQFQRDEKAIIQNENRIADLYRIMGNFEQAEKNYQQLMEWYPTDILAYVSYGLMLLEENKVEQAREIYQSAEKLPDAQKNSNFRKLALKLRYTQ